MLPQRKPLRLKGYDYSTEGAYFVTVCTFERKALLGCVVGTGVLARPPYAQEDSLPGVELSPYGVVVDKVIRQLHGFYKDISVDCYTIMPNHVHLLLSVLENGRAGTPVPTKGMSTIAKWISTLKRFSNKECGCNLWQARFHDHIIRDQRDYDRHAEYIETNPLRWELDELYIAY